MAGLGRSDEGPITGINVTPLVDITLVLLIIFMVTAKMVVAPALPMNLPRAEASEAVQVVLSVAVPVAGAVRVDGAEIADARLVARARAALAGSPGLRAVIAADRAVPHGRVMEVMGLLRTAGVAQIAFATQAAPAP
jgi:biopolymer transport protein TolR